MKFKALHEAIGNRQPAVEEVSRSLESKTSMISSIVSKAEQAVQESLRRVSTLAVKVDGLDSKLNRTLSTSLAQLERQLMVN
jgi:hypothetical protein